MSRASKGGLQRVKRSLRLKAAVATRSVTQKAVPFASEQVAKRIGAERLEAFLVRRLHNACAMLKPPIGDTIG
jgi:hypothetical protein